MFTELYLKSIRGRYQLGNATEHTFRGDLQILIESIVPEVKATNEPKRQQCGAPDYIITKEGIPIGFIEAKDIGDNDLKGNRASGNKEQFDRYKASLDNLIITDYLTFHFYRNGQFVNEISIGHLEGNIITVEKKNFAEFESLIKDFCIYHAQTITSSKKLAEMMAGKARLLADVIKRALEDDNDLDDDSTLKDQLIGFKGILIHDITPQAFADVYAQTIAYGMFAARLHDPSINTFSRREAAELIPKSNPFLRKLFGYIAGPDIDDRIVWIVDHLAEIFLACDLQELLKDYEKETMQEDPIIHFYEIFLSEYDAKLRKARGVWYTPQPVVSFIARAVDQVLKDEFDLPMGLADNSKIKVKVNQLGKQVEKEVHRVQILDPATGTGTFLVEIVKEIYKKYEAQKGIWNDYVENHLIPRLNGFEILMASYAMAHLKLEMLLTETGWNPTRNQRLKIYLTNSLEESHPDTGTLFASWLSQEANEANFIKRDTPVMVITGNPPYSGESANKGEWIMKLMEDYKKEPGGKEKLKERNPKWINDDYVKFLRYGQHFIEKNNAGIIAFINPHGFLDNPTFRGMRWNLLKTFDKIYTIDLHGNTKKKETAADNGADDNVFDIMQGVSINILVKSGQKKQNELGKVFQYDLLGKRELKYDFLSTQSIKSITFKEITNIAPSFFFKQKDFMEQSNYDKGFSVLDIFQLSSVGIVTAKEAVFVKDDAKELKTTVLENFSINFDEGAITRITYRPFDNKYVYYDSKIIERAREKVMHHFINVRNVGLVVGRQGQVVGSMPWNLSFVTNSITDFNLYYRGGGVLFPLYQHLSRSIQQSIDQSTERTPNLNIDIIEKIAEAINCIFVPDENICVDLPADKDGIFYPLTVLDYIYAVLHSPSYREKYKEFLKIDFPRVPYPTDNKMFTRLSDIGCELRQLHLMESEKLNNLITRYPEIGSNEVEKVQYEGDRVYINKQQYFEGVPEIAWNFYIGGYQPAQKWLKDRKGKKLGFEDILHYQKVIVALVETDMLMKKVNLIDI